MGLGQMFDIGTLGSISSGSTVSRMVPSDYSQAPSPNHLATVDTSVEEHGHGTGMPDFMLTDDTPATWPSMLPIFGWVTSSLPVPRFEAYASLVHPAGGMIGVGSSQTPTVERRSFYSDNTTFPMPIFYTCLYYVKAYLSATETHWQLELAAVYTQRSMAHFKRKMTSITGILPRSR